MSEVSFLEHLNNSQQNYQALKSIWLEKWKNRAQANYINVKRVQIGKAVSMKEVQILLFKNVRRLFFATLSDVKYCADCTLNPK